MLTLIDVATQHHRLRPGAGPLRLRQRVAQVVHHRQVLHQDAQLDVRLDHLPLLGHGVGQRHAPVAHGLRPLGALPLPRRPFHRYALIVESPSFFFELGTKLQQDAERRLDPSVVSLPLQQKRWRRVPYFIFQRRMNEILALGLLTRFSFPFSQRALVLSGFFSMCHQI